MPMRKSVAVELFWKLHPRIYRWSGGRLLANLTNMPVLLLRTRGRKTGEERETALTYLPRGDAYVVIGSFLGEPRHPGWVHNLRAAPECEIQVGSRSLPVRAREAEGEERAAVWKDVVARQPDYSEYEGFTERIIPVVILEPRENR